MDVSSQHFLAGSCFSNNQDSNIGFCHLESQLFELGYQDGLSNYFSLSFHQVFLPNIQSFQQLYGWNYNCPDRQFFCCSRSLLF